MWHIVQHKLLIVLLNNLYLPWLVSMAGKLGGCPSVAMDVLSVLTSERARRWPADALFRLANIRSYFRLAIVRSYFRLDLT
jgi:hypothetical protein